MEINFENLKEEVLCPVRYSDILKTFLASRNVTRFWGNYRFCFLKLIIHLFLNKLK